MHLNIPSDLRAEIVSNYIGETSKDIVFLGGHKRNAYEDILSIARDDDAVKIEVSRLGLYDILPEALFHPIDRFDNLPANEYKERFAEEIELQRIEESNARSFFSAYDRAIFDLSAVVARIKDDEYGDNHVLSDIICDSMSDEYKSNRFVARAKEFTPRCQSIRGDNALLTLMLRKIMADEGLRLVMNNSVMSFEDKRPRYNYRLQEDAYATEPYLGNCYDETVVHYDIQYWNDDYCDDSFLDFVDEIKVFEKFVNEYFIGIETSVCFNLSATTLPVRLSDTLCYNYLNFNTNL